MRDRVEIRRDMAIGALMGRRHMRGRKARRARTVMAGAAFGGRAREHALYMTRLALNILVGAG